MANYEATKYDYSGANLTGIQGVNTGLIIPWSSTSVPEGFLECDGTAVSRTTYADLFAVVGTTYGVGDGSTTFNLPDLSEKCCSKKGPATNVGTAAGSSTTTVAGNVTGNVDNTSLPVNLIGPHSHPQGVTGTPGETPGGPAMLPGLTDASGGGGAHTHNSSISFSGGQVSTLQETLTLLYIIKT